MGKKALGIRSIKEHFIQYYYPCVEKVIEKKGFPTVTNILGFVFVVTVVWFVPVDFLIDTPDRKSVV